MGTTKYAPRYLVIVDILNVYYKDDIHIWKWTDFPQPSNTVSPDMSRSLFSKAFANVSQWVANETDKFDAFGNFSARLDINTVFSFPVVGLSYLCKLAII